MTLQFLIGGIVSVISIMIHALTTIGVVGIARSWGLRHTARPKLDLMAVMVGTAVALMVAHTLEVFLWALAYAFVGAAPAGSDFLYFAFVNYTTLGYGDIIPYSNLARVLASVEVFFGVMLLLFGVSELLEYARERRQDRPHKN